MTAKVPSIQNELESLSKSPQSFWKKLYSLFRPQKRHLTSNDECAAVQSFKNYSFDKIQRKCSNSESCFFEKKKFHQRQFNQRSSSSNIINSFQTVAPCDMKKLANNSARKRHHSIQSLTKFSSTALSTSQ